MNSKVTSNEQFFPGSPTSPLKEEFKSRQIGAEIAASLHLQMCLYFNAIFYPFWAFTTLVLFFDKYEDIHGLYQIILTIVLIITIPLEAFRLYLGYVGNLSEKVPELAGFWMVSILLQCPLQTYLLVSDRICSQSAEQAIQYVICSMLYLELIFGFVAMKRMAKQRANNFYVTSLLTRSKELSRDHVE